MVHHEYVITSVHRWMQSLNISLHLSIPSIGGSKMKRYAVGFHAPPYELSKHPVVTAAAAFCCNGYRLGNIAGDRITSAVSRIFTSSNSHSLALPRAFYESFEKLLCCPPRTDHLYICTVAALTMRTCITSTILTSAELRTGFQQPGPLKNALICFLFKNCWGEDTPTC